MIKVLLITFLNTSIVLAYNILIEGEGNLKNCTSNSNETIFYCTNKNNEEILVKASKWEYKALKKDKSGRFKSADVYEVKNKDGEEVFLASLDRNSFMDEKTENRYEGKLDEYIEKERHIYNSFFKNSKEDEVQKSDGKLYSFYQATKLEIEKNEKDFTKLLNSNELNVKLRDGQELKCIRDNSPECPLFSCKDKNQDMETIVLKDKSLYSSQIDSFNFKNGKFIAVKNLVNSLQDENGNTILKLRDLKKEVFSPDMLVPSGFRNNPQLFNDLSNSAYKSRLNDQIKSCSERTRNLISGVLQTAQEEFDNAKMIQYIDIVNGILESNYINDQSLPDNSCNYKGAYYNREAYKKSLEVQTMNKKTISMRQAQELFNKAQARQDISWDYTIDGCYARAFLMTKMFEEEGIHVDKAWLRGSLQIPGQSQSATWGYHVAPLVYVEGRNGEVTEMIIDPSVAKTPLTPKEWARTMKINLDTSETLQYPTPENTKFYNKTSYSVTNSKPYWPTYNDKLSEEEKMDRAMQTMFEYGADVGQWN